MSSVFLGFKNHNVKINIIANICITLHSLENARVPGKRKTSRHFGPGKGLLTYSPVPRLSLGQVVMWKMTSTLVNCKDLKCLHPTSYSAVIIEIQNPTCKLVRDTFVKTPSCTSRTLDLSFNLIKCMENLSCLRCLKKLYFVQNKISKIEGVEELAELDMIELGANKIRVSRLLY